MFGNSKVVIAANFDNNDQVIDIEFPNNGVWYDFLNETDFEIDSNFYGNWVMPQSTAFVFVSSLPIDGIAGDVNSDNLVDILDLVMIVNCIVGSCQIVDDSIADFNSDGSINILDIVSLANFILET